MVANSRETCKRQFPNEWLTLFCGPASFGLVGFLLFWLTPQLNIGTAAETYRAPLLYGSLTAFGIALSWAAWSLYRLRQNGRLPAYLLVSTAAATAVVGQVLNYWP